MNDDFFPRFKINFEIYLKMHKICNGSSILNRNRNSMKKKKKNEEEAKKKYNGNNKPISIISSMQVRKHGNPQNAHKQTRN